MFARTLMVAFSVMVLAIYPVYTNYKYGLAKTQVDRHLAIMEKRSHFFNPWQYRILAPLVSEAGCQLARPVLDRLPLGRLAGKYGAEAAKYHVIFVLHRLALDLAIIFLVFAFYQRLGISKAFALVGVVFASFSMSNAIFESDLSFNTYYDVVFYLLAGVLLLGRSSSFWFVPLVLLACLNRETSLFIPFMLLWRMVDWQGHQLAARPMLWRHGAAVGLSLLAYGVIYWSVRQYFGFRPPLEKVSPEPGWDMLLHNLFAPVPINEVWGIFLFLPLLCLCFFWRASLLLRFLFCLIVPLWFLIHYPLVHAQEARVFLVPTLLIFLPMSLQVAQQYHQDPASFKAA